MKLTVVIPSYNYAERLGPAIQSVLDNTRRPDEIVVVDDGSTDRSAEVAEAFPEVRVIRKDNGGMSSAINVGIGQSSGDVVVLLDADDEMLPDRLAWIETAFADDDVVLAWHPLIVTDDHGLERGLIPHIPLPEGDLAASMATAGLAAFPVTSGIAARRATLLEIGPIPEDRFRTSGDAYLVRTLPFAGRVRASTRPLGIYSVHAGSDSRSLAAPNRQSMIDQLNRRLDMADAERELLATTARAAGHRVDERRIVGADRAYQAMFLARARLTTPGRRAAKRAMDHLVADGGVGLAARKAFYLVLPRRITVTHELMRSGHPDLGRTARMWSAFYWRVAALIDRWKNRQAAISRR